MCYEVNLYVLFGINFLTSIILPTLQKTRTIALRLLDAVEAGIYNNLTEEDFCAITQKAVMMTSFLALNTAFVSCKVPELSL